MHAYEEAVRARRASPSRRCSSRTPTSPTARAQQRARRARRAARRGRRADPQRERLGRGRGDQVRRQRPARRDGRAARRRRSPRAPLRRRRPPRRDGERVRRRATMPARRAARATREAEGASARAAWRARSKRRAAPRSPARTWSSPTRASRTCSQRIAAGEDVGTLFVPRRARLNARSTGSPSRCARAATSCSTRARPPRCAARARASSRSASLGVRGDFRAGDAVRILDPDGDEIGRGLARFDVIDAARIAGKKATERCNASSTETSSSSGSSELPAGGPSGAPRRFGGTFRLLSPVWPAACTCDACVSKSGLTAASSGLPLIDPWQSAAQPVEERCCWNDWCDALARVERHLFALVARIAVRLRDGRVGQVQHDRHAARNAEVRRLVALQS